MENRSDFLIIGAGIIGMSVAKALLRKYPDGKITILEKEPDVAFHSSGRNSGVLHAGFYYTADSLKAKFTRDGNRALREYCEKNGLGINRCGKVVVTKDESELEALHELEYRGKRNGVNVALIDEKRLKELDLNVKTYKEALHSPDTATVDPLEVCRFLKEELIGEGVDFRFAEGYAQRIDTHTVISTKKRRYRARKILNCAGLYADRIAREFGFSQSYVIIPFKGIYLKYTPKAGISSLAKPVRTNVYPVPNLKNPFLGVHFTVTVDGTIKIGPTAIPAFWRENYRGLENFSLREMREILGYEAKLFWKDAFGFRSLAFEEIRKYNRRYFISLAASMVKEIDADGFDTWSRPGIRAQLLDTRSLELLQDFVVEGDRDSVHILNAVSPAFTSAFPFTEWIVDQYID